MPNTLTPEELMPLRLKDLAFNSDEWALLFSSVKHDGSVLADTLFRRDDMIQRDFFHSKETNIRIRRNNAVDLCLVLLRNNIRVEFVDGLNSSNVIRKISPPLWNKFYNQQ